MAQEKILYYKCHVNMLLYVADVTLTFPFKAFALLIHKKMMAFSCKSTGSPLQPSSIALLKREEHRSLLGKKEIKYKLRTHFVFACTEAKVDSSRKLEVVVNHLGHFYMFHCNELHILSQVMFIRNFYIAWFSICQGIKVQKYTC